MHPPTTEGVELMPIFMTLRLRGLTLVCKHANRCLKTGPSRPRWGGNSAVTGLWGRATLLGLLFGSGGAPGKPHNQQICPAEGATVRPETSLRQEVSISVLIEHQDTPDRRYL